MATQPKQSPVPAHVTTNLVPAHVITSLAILKANWDSAGTDYIQNFVPFVAECLASAGQEQIGVAGIRALVRERFGLQLPQGAIRSVMARCVKIGYAKRSQGAFVLNRSALQGINLGRQRADALRKHENLCA